MKESPTDVRWRWCRFDELSVHELQNIYTARQLVFVLEQECPYLDADGVDEQSHHLAAWSARQREPLAYARVVAPGVKYAEPSMGRVVLDAALRGSGLADQLVAEGLRRADAVWSGQGNRISAQAHLQRFYGRHGYQPVGDVYAEDDIPHIQMLRPPQPHPDEEPPCPR